MRPLVLSGRGHRLGVRCGRLDHSNLYTHERTFYSPSRTPPFDTVVIEGNRGIVTLDALQWLGVRGVSLLHVDFNGELTSVTLPNRGPNGHAETRLAQLKAHLDLTRRLAIAIDLVRAKVERLVADGLVSRRVSTNPPPMTTFDHVLTWEAHVTADYWERLGVVRDYPSAHDATNALINYAHALLCGRVLVELHRQGFDSDVGFLHAVSSYRHSLVYDLAEPWYATADAAALEVNRILPRRAFRSRTDGRVVLREVAVTATVRTFARRWTAEEPRFRKAIEAFALDLSLGRVGDYRRALRARHATGATAPPIPIR